MRKVLNWGIVSTGYISQQFCQDMQHVTNGKLYAVGARKQQDADKFAQQHSIPHAYQGYQALFNNPNIDIIYIGTPHTLHFEQTKAALNAGKHVLCEKPIAVSSDEFIELAQLAKTKSLFLMEAMWTYFLPAILKAKQWVNDGRIGKIKHIKADFGYPMPYDENSRVWDANLAGGCLLDMGIYPIAIAQYFLNAPMKVTHVDAEKAENGVDKDVLILGQAQGAKLSLATSFQCKLQNWAYIIGDEGYIAIPNFWRADCCSLYQLDECIETFQDERKSLGYNFEAEAVGEAIINGLIEHPLLPHSISNAFQSQLEQIKALF